MPDNIRRPSSSYTYALTSGRTLTTMNQDAQTPQPQGSPTPTSLPMGPASLKEELSATPTTGRKRCLGPRGTSIGHPHHIHTHVPVDAHFTIRSSPTSFAVGDTQGQPTPTPRSQRTILARYITRLLSLSGFYIPTPTSNLIAQPGSTSTSFLNATTDHSSFAQGGAVRNAHDREETMPDTVILFIHTRTDK
ncbi:hypothetical protein CF319_g3045 [Tilletia indica]|nr:hypothetical protein CF319_g3045 [Tilletia indica]